MTVTVKVLVPPSYMDVSQTTEYTVPASTRAIIDKATVTHTGTVARTFSINLVQSGDTASNSNKVIETKSIQPGETYLCPELVGQVLEAGGFISSIASAASGLSLRISGREIT